MHESVEGSDQTSIFRADRTINPNSTAIAIYSLDVLGEPPGPYGSGLPKRGRDPFDLALRNSSCTSFRDFGRGGAGVSASALPLLCTFSVDRSRGSEDREIVLFGKSAAGSSREGVGAPDGSVCPLSD